MSLIALYYVCSVGIYVDNEMARNIARVKLKTIISRWNYRFYL